MSELCIFTSSLSREEVNFCIGNNAPFEKILLSKLWLTGKGYIYAFKKLLDVEANQLFPDDWVNIVNENLETIARLEKQYYKEHFVPNDLFIVQQVWNEWYIQNKANKEIFAFIYE